MKNALILHGTQGSSKENWFPWLKKELEKKGYKVWLPDLPGADVPNIPNYLGFIFANKDFEFNSETVLIGHSSGAVACLSVLNELPQQTKIDTCIMVSPFEKDSDGGEWEANRELFDYKPNFDEVKNKVWNLVLIISDNDPYCPVDYVKNLGKVLSGDVIITKGDGHFSVGSGGPKYKKLPLLLNYL